MLLLIAVRSCTVERTVSSLMFAHLLYDSGGRGSTGEGGIHARHLSFSPRQTRRRFAGRSRSVGEMHRFESRPRAVYLMV